KESHRGRPSFDQGVFTTVPHSARATPSPQPHHPASQPAPYARSPSTSLFSKSTSPGTAPSRPAARSCDSHVRAVAAALPPGRSVDTPSHKSPKVADRTSTTAPRTPAAKIRPGPPIFAQSLRCVLLAETIHRSLGRSTNPPDSAGFPPHPSAAPAPRTQSAASSV